MPSMTLLEQLAQHRTNAVIDTAVSLAIEKIAAETARDLLQDPAFREELRTLARQSVSRTMRDLRRPRAKTKKRHP